MTAETASVVAGALAAAAAVVALSTVAVLGRRLRELRRLVDELRAETVPLVREARVVVDQAATEMERVGDVLGSAEAVSATVDSASRLAYRAFANPIVKVLAFGSGVGGALRRLFGRQSRPAPSAARSAAVAPTTARRHRRRRRAGVA